MTSFFTLFIGFIITHTIIDFYFQPIAWVNDKEQNKWKSKKLLAHSLLHSAAACLPIIMVTSDLRSIFCLVIIIGGSHWLIDLLKVKLGKDLRFFILDQVLHILVLMAIALHATEINLNLLFTNIMNELSLTHGLIILAYLLILKPSSIIISKILAKYSPIDVGENKGLLSGGEIIGYLERLLILTFVIKGQYAVIGFILAAKSIFRFGDLNKAKDQKLTEYILLGSLLSVTITSFIGILVALK
jgi:hypothetical protein